MEYILKRITDSDYYFNKYFNYYILPKLQSILAYYNNYFFESKIEDIALIENIIYNKKSDLNYNKYLGDYEIAQKMNERYSIIDFLLKEKSPNIQKTEENLNTLKNKWEILENKINNKQFEDIKNEDKNYLKEYCNYCQNKEIIFKIFNKDIYKWLLNKNVNTRINSINSEEEDINVINNDSNNNKYEEKEKTNFQLNQYNNKNLNNDQTNIKYKQKEKKESIELNVSDIISNNYYENIFNEKESIYLSDNIFPKTKERHGNNYYSSFYQSYFINNNICNEKEEYSIIKFIKKIKSHNNYTSEFIKELTNRNIVSFGTDNKIIFYENIDNDVNFLISEKIKDKINNIEEIKIEKNNQHSLLVCTKKKIYSIDMEYNIKTLNLDETLFNSLYIINETSLLLCQENRLAISHYLIDKLIEPIIEEISEGYFKNGIVIDRNLIASTSNCVISGGRDIIIFYRIDKNKIIKEIEGYSFLLSHTGLYLMEINNHKILLCACKKYIKGQKNGILLINNLESIDCDNFNNKKNIKYYYTKNFEVYCFCQLSILTDNNIIFDNTNSLTKTKYFFVGGFDIEKGKGCIKLFKINDEISEIEVIEDNIKIKNFNGFKGVISNIIQLSENQKIIISCWDGNNYLFSNPNLKKYLYFEEYINNMNI